MIDQGVTAALAARDALRSTNGDDSHNSGTGVRRTERAARECTYTTFLNVNHYLSKAPKELLVFLNELALLCERMFSEESDKVEKYVGGLPDMIHGSCNTPKYTSMQRNTTSGCYFIIQTHESQIYDTSGYVYERILRVTVATAHRYMLASFDGTERGCRRKWTW
nr:hypothetical protein [Tanacetum cinerariifolium]